MALAATPAPSHSARNTTEVVLTVTEASLPLSRIEPSTLNPRKTFSQEAIDELVASIREVGLLQPLVVRPHQDRYVLIAGERRWRACKLAGLRSAPARIIEGADDAIHLRLALVENLQRQDLDPIEEAEGYAQLNRIVGLKQSEIATAVHRSQPAIANTMRLLELPEPVIELVRQRTLTPAHGKALLKFAPWPKLCEAIAEWAVKVGATSRRLESGLSADYRGDGIPWDPFTDRDLVDRVAEMSHLSGQDVDGQLADAGITVWGSGWYKLTPDVPQYRAWRAEREQERQAELNRALQKARAAAKADGKEIIRLEKLPYDSYERVEPRTWPKACGKDCSCRALAQDRDGRVVEISTDPAHIRKLRAAEARERSKKEKEGRRTTAETLDRILADAPPLDHRGLAIVVADRLWQFTKSVRTQLIERHLQGVVDEKALTDYSGRRDTTEQLLKLPLVTLLKVLVEGTLLEDMHSHLQFGGLSTRLAWYMRQGGGDPFHGDSLKMLTARLAEAKEQASNTMHLPGESAMWQDTVHAIEQRMHEVQGEMQPASEAH